MLYLKQTGDPADIHEDAPRLCREAADLIASGRVDAPQLGEMITATREVEQALPELTEALANELRVKTDAARLTHLRTSDLEELSTCYRG